MQTIIENISVSLLNLQDIFALPFYVPSITAMVQLHSLADLINDNEKLEDIFSPDELKMLLAFKFSKRKTEWLGGRLAAKLAFKKKYPVNQLKSIIIKTKDNGAPYIDSISSTLNGEGIDKDVWKHLSISHSGNYAIAGISIYPVGIDIEEILPRYPALYSIAFTEYEIKTINSLLSDKKDEYITRLWTAKEALLKLFQTGLNVDLNTIEIYVDGDGEANFKIKNNKESPFNLPLIKGENDLENISLFTIKKETYIISIAIQFRVLS